jgi:hypothetical protein
LQQIDKINSEIEKEEEKFEKELLKIQKFEKEIKLKKLIQKKIKKSQKL